jgi:hypothetical protein
MFIHCGLPSPLEIPIIAQEREQSLKCFGLHVINAYDKENGYEEHKKKMDMNSVLPNTSWLS